MPLHKLPEIEKEDLRLMSTSDIARSLAMNDSLKKANEEKGYDWHGDVEKLKDHGPKGVAKWRALGSPTGKPLRSVIGLDPKVHAAMHRRLHNPVGPGLNAVRSLKKAGRKSRKTRRHK